MWLEIRFVTQPSSPSESSRPLAAWSHFPSRAVWSPKVGDASLREIIHGAYRIVYRIQAESVQVVTVHHAARLLGA